MEHGQDDRPLPTDQQVRDMLQAASALTVVAELAAQADLGPEAHAYAGRLLGWAESLRSFAYGQLPPAEGWTIADVAEHVRMLSGWVPADPPPG